MGSSGNVSREIQSAPADGVMTDTKHTGPTGAIAISIADHYLADADADRRRDLARAIINAMQVCEKEVADAVLNAANAVYKIERADLTDALKDMLRILEAVRVSSGLGHKQIERMSRARAALAQSGAASAQQGI